MISLFPLRPIQIVDVSFQLLRKKFIASFFTALAITIPFQIIVWIFEISITDQAPGEDLTGRTIFVVLILQFFSVGLSLALVSNVLSRVTGKAYCQNIFNNLYQVHRSPARLAVGVYHVGIQFAFVVSMLGFRFLVGRVLIDYQANVLAFVLFFIVFIPWAFATLRVGFAVPISVHEGGSLKAVRTRTKQINKVHFFKLLGVYCISIFMIWVLVVPSLSVLQIFIAKGLIKSAIGNWAFFNLIVATIIASISVVYSYILTVTYFNARIEHEGFDIAVSIQQLENEGGDNGKLLNPVA